MHEPSLRRLRYHAFLYGFEVRSDLPLSLSSETARFPRLGKSTPYILAFRIPRSRLRAVKWFHELRAPNGSRECRFGRKADCLLIDFPGLALFQIRGDGSRIRYAPAPGASENDVAALFLTQALPLAVQLSGAEVLHAAAVRIGTGAVAFLGRQGQGKSTLAAAFHTRAFDILSDDAVPLRKRGGRFWATPAIPELRLYRATGKRLLGKSRARTAHPALRKFRISLETGFQKRPIPLVALFCLETGKKLEIERLGPGEACQRLLASSFRIELDNPARLKKELLALAALVERVPVFSLKYPRGLNRLGRVTDAVLRELGR